MRAAGYLSALPPSCSALPFLLLLYILCVLSFRSYSPPGLLFATYLFSYLSLHPSARSPAASCHLLRLVTSGLRLKTQTEFRRVEQRGARLFPAGAAELFFSQERDSRHLFSKWLEHGGYFSSATRRDVGPLRHNGRE